MRFPVSLEHTERIGKILRIKITTEFTGGYTVIRDAEIGDQLLLDAVVGTDITDLIIQRL